MLSYRSCRFAVCLALLWGLACGAEADGAPPLVPLCARCHGEGGVSPYPDVPVIAGQPYTLIADNLRAFRAGERPCTKTHFRDAGASGPTVSMCVFAGGLDDAAIEALAAWFSSRTFEPREQAFDASRVAAGAEVHERAGCDMCHVQGGRQTRGLACRLAGQWTPYLRKSFREFRAGERAAPAVMTDAINALGEDDIENLLQYYASQQHWRD